MRYSWISEGVSEGTGAGEEGAELEAMAVAVVEEETAEVAAAVDDEIEMDSPVETEDVGADTDVDADAEIADALCVAGALEIEPLDNNDDDEIIDEGVTGGVGVALANVSELADPENPDEDALGLTLGPLEEGAESELDAPVNEAAADAEEGRTGERLAEAAELD